MKRLSKLFQLNSIEKILLCQGLFILLLVRLGLLLMSFAKLKQIVDRTPRLIANQQSIIIPSCAQITWAVNVVGNLPPSAKCLARALTAQVLLHCCSYQSTLVIGVTKNQQGDLNAHAWVEKDGKIIMGGSPHISRYHVLISQ